MQKYEIHSYRGAAIILAERNPTEFADLLAALESFSITTDIIRKAGGNESEIPKKFSRFLRPRGWNETAVQGDLVVRLLWRESMVRGSRRVSEKRQREIVRKNFLDGHKIDYVKNRVAFDLEWNSKDQTFDRDLYAFNAFSTCGVIDVGVLVTRSQELDLEVIRKLGTALRANGSVEISKKNGNARMTYEKFGASTTWMGKLLYRLNAGRNGGCPVLAVGIRPACVADWPQRAC